MILSLPLKTLLMKSWSSTPSTESGRRWARWRRPDMSTQSLLSSTVPVRPSSSVTEELHNRYRSHFQFWNLLYICLFIIYLWLLSCQNCDSIIHQINTILAKQNFLFQTNQLSYNYWCREIWLLPSPCLSYYNQVNIRRIQTKNLNVFEIFMKVDTNIGSWE